jgi:rubrerythrin
MKRTADYTLQVAIELEQRGQTFYESLSFACEDTEIAVLATFLAKNEEAHIATFKRMLDALPDELRGPRLTEEELSTATEELRINIIPNPRTVRGVVLSSGIRDALKMAIDMEAATVDFYTVVVAGITHLDATVLRGVVNEEKKHLNMLLEVRKRLFA